MPSMKLTPTGVRRLVAPDPSGKQVIYSSVEQAGLQLVVSGSTAARSWAVQCSLKGRTIRIPLGPVSAQVDEEEIGRMSRRAQEIREMTRLGLDPRVEIELRSKTEASKNKTLSDLFDEYRTTARWSGLRPASRRLYNFAWEGMLGDLGGQIARTITVGELSRQHAEWVVRSHGLARASVMLLRSIWRNAQIMGSIERSLRCPGADLGEVTPDWAAIRVRNTDVPDEKLGDFLQAIDAQPVSVITRSMLTFTLFSGLRSSEARDLRWDEVDLERSLIRIPAARVKTKVEFVLPINSVMREALDVARERKLYSDSYGINRNFVWTLADGHFDRAHPTVNGLLKKIAADAGVDGLVTTHTLRKIFGRVAEETVSLGSAKRLLNHSVNNDVTLSRYSMRNFAQLLRDSEVVAQEILARAAGRMPGGGAEVVDLELVRSRA